MMRALCMVRRAWLVGAISRALALSFAAATTLAGCAEAQKAAARDPQKCERDPSCASKQGKSRDCASQCADNIECMERCEQVQKATNP